VDEGEEVVLKVLVVLAQFHSLSGPPHRIPAYSWEDPEFNTGANPGFNASHHSTPSSGSGGGSVPASRLNNDFGNMD